MKYAQVVELRRSMDNVFALSDAVVEAQTRLAHRGGQELAGAFNPIPAPARSREDGDGDSRVHYQPCGGGRRVLRKLVRD